jgi:hypothetical protein
MSVASWQLTNVKTNLLQRSSLQPASSVLNEYSATCIISWPGAREQTYTSQALHPKDFPLDDSESEEKKFSIYEPTEWIWEYDTNTEIANLPRTASYS